jgi:hypothetical protein
MKAHPSSRTLGAVALAALQARDPLTFERHFQYLTPPALTTLDEGMMSTIAPSQDDRNTALAQAVVRRMVHKCLDGKYSNARISSARSIIMENALKYHTLPEALQQELCQTYEASTPPTTWFEALEHLKSISNNDPAELWRLILDHPMTAYVPMQCQDCGHVIPDLDDGTDDADLGLSELDSTGHELELRGGWFRGRPRGAKILALKCPHCKSSTATTTRWYRSGHPQIMLTPSRWGRLCGEQEDLRMMLADYLQIPLRLCIPLDWDHIWSEFYNGRCWEVPDDSARNFAVRLEEGIGAWTRLWVIHPNPDLCQDVTEDYFKCKSDEDGGGRADDAFAGGMDGYRKIVEAARMDPTAEATQAKTLYGFVLERANFTSDRITEEMRKAVKDYGERSWWQL